MKTPFHLLLFKTSHAQKCRVWNFCGRVGLNPGQPKILTVLDTEGSCRQKDLAHRCDIEPATVSRLLDGMEEMGLVNREEDPADRRAVRVTITAKGKETRLQLWDYLARLEGEALAGFSREEQEQLKGYLARVYHNLTGGRIE